MKATDTNRAATTLAVAVQSALLAMATTAAYAQDASVEELTAPNNYLELGLTNVDKASPKFGEYNGLKNNGVTAIGNFGVNGGSGYGDANGLTRWSVTGSNLGLDSRELNANVSNQGQWSVGVGYDELRHNTTTGYQTPYNGTMGGNNFTLPAGFAPVTNTVTGLTTTKRQEFNTVDVSNTRKNTSFNASYTFNPQWRLTFDFNNLEQSGAKLMAFGADGSAGGSGEKVSILPNPTNYTTNMVNLALDWTGEKGHLTGSYFGSFFRDHYNSVTWSQFAAAGITDLMTTAPDNNFHQLNLTGGYKFSSATKLTGGVSYGRNTQNSSFVDTALVAAGGLMVTPSPISSLDGLVVTTHGDAKLVNQTTKDLKLSAGIKYDKRDNRTASNIYNFNAIDGGHPALYPNAPYSNSKAQYEIAGDYRLNDRSHFRLAYNHDDIKRWCNNYASGLYYPAGTNCVTDTGTKEDRLGLTYRLRVRDGMDFNLGYVYGDRKTSYDTHAQAPFLSTKGAIDPITGLLTSTTAYGVNGGDYIGFHPIFDASRTQQVLKLGTNWDVNNRLSLGINGRYTDDSYNGDTYGAQNGTSWNINLDATYNYANDGAVFAYVAQDYRDRYLRSHTDNATTLATGTTKYDWGNKMKDQSITYGLGFKQGGLMHGRLDLKGDLTVSDSKSNYSTDFLAWFAGTTTATSCTAATSMTCGATPDISNKLTQFKLTGSYKLDKHSKVAIGYLHQKLSSTDYFYNGYQYLYTATGTLPTNQQSGSYSVNVIAASYNYSFR